MSRGTSAGPKSFRSIAGAPDGIAAKYIPFWPAIAAAALLTGAGEGQAAGRPSN